MPEVKKAAGKAKELTGKFLGWAEKKTLCTLLGRVRDKFMKEATLKWREAGYERTEAVKELDEIVRLADELHKELCE